MLDRMSLPAPGHGLLPWKPLVRLQVLYPVAQQGDLARDSHSLPIPGLDGDLQVGHVAHQLIQRKPHGHQRPPDDNQSTQKPWQRDAKVNDAGHFERLIFLNHGAPRSGRCCLVVQCELRLQPVDASRLIRCDG